MYQALKAGASGFLLKTAPREELARAVQTIAAGTTLLAPTLTTRLVQTYVSRLFTKLDLRDRVQAVVLAYEGGLVTPKLS